jgi:hypothetical protein
VADIGDSLRATDVERLDYFYKTQLKSRRSYAHADKPWKTGLALLRGLEEGGVFSHSNPAGLASAMSEVKREDLKKQVEEFVETHDDWITRGRKGKSLLPGLPGTTTTEQERDGPYYPQKQTENVSQPATVATAGDEDYGYTKFIPVSRALSEAPGHKVSPESSLAPSTPPSSPPFSSSSSTDGSHPNATHNEEGDYSYPYQWSRESWMTTASTQQLKLTQKMRLLTEPMRSMVRTQQNKTLTSKPIHWQHFCSILILKLHIDTVGPHDGVAATLFLEKRVTTSGLLTAELVLTHPRKLSLKKSGSSNEGSSPLMLFQGSVVMDMPDEATPPGLSRVAKFPMILSHRHLLNKKLLKAPFLDISLTLKQQ